jgi:hypothetical protein
MAIKLARDLRLPAEEAVEIVDLAKERQKVAFSILAPGYLDSVSEAFTGMTVKEAAWMKEAEEFDALRKEAAVEDLITKATTPGETQGTPTTTLPTHDVGPDLKAKLLAALKNPYVLGGLAVGGGAAAYGASRLAKKKTKTPDTEEDEDIKEKAAGIGDFLSKSGQSFGQPVVDGVWNKGKEVVNDLKAPGGILEAAGQSFTDPLKDHREFLGKESAAFYDQEIDPRVQFNDYDWDEDMDLPVENSGMFQEYAEAQRDRYSRQPQNYLDAHDPGDARNTPHSGGDLDHIPDEMILKMVRPMEEMAQLGQQLGLDSLMDHGAVGSMVKVFDVKPYMQEYISKLENSLDHLGRLVFMLYWKPKDFSELFGQDDIPQIENKLTGVFSNYGNLILELLQSSGEKD